ncbi:MAG: FAD-dependent monooxygenase [Pseudomonadota bacterium]
MRGRSALVSGGGIGGLAAALAISRSGWDVRLFEQAPAFAEAGAGIQLGPNVMKILQGWGLSASLAGVAAFPGLLQVRSALTGKLLAGMSLSGMTARYGAPYATVHRADLHTVLLDAVRQTDTHLHADRALQAFSQTPDAVSAQTTDALDVEGDVLIGADGLWSTVRRQLLGDGLPRRTGHLAYRTLVQQSALPETLRSQNVTVWLGPRMHVVQYPVRCGDYLNVVVLAEGNIGSVGDAGGNANRWDHQPDLSSLSAVTSDGCPALQDLMAALSGWRVWQLCDREPMRGAWQHALGRVALLGDAAHPMLPYLAQGAGMAIEDAAELGHVLQLAADPAFDVPTMLQRYALNRWQRNAKVQATAMRNARIFHASGLLRVARDASMKLLGERLLDVPWLYGASPKQI